MGVSRRVRKRGFLLGRPVSIRPPRTYLRQLTDQGQNKPGRGAEGRGRRRLFVAALRLLEEEAAVQAEAVKASQESAALTTNQYKAGTVSYLDVITAQTIALTKLRSKSSAGE